jgi:DNA-binding CsgD family transcriptional regulator
LLRVPREAPRSRKGLPLSERQVAIVDMISKGFRNGRIAELLGVPERSVKFHISRALEKIGTRDRIQLSLWWLSGASDYRLSVEGALERARAAEHHHTATLESLQKTISDLEKELTRLTPREGVKEWPHESASCQSAGPSKSTIDTPAATEATTTSPTAN